MRLLESIARRIEPRLASACRSVRRLPGARLGIRVLERRYAELHRGNSDPWIVISNFDGDMALRINRASNMGRTIYWHGHFSKNELAVLDRLLRPNMVFVDAGANFGEFTLFASKRAARVVAIEPEPSCYQQLVENLNLNGPPNVLAIEVALGERETTVPLFCHASYADPGFEDDVVASAMRRPDSIEIGRARCRRLDDVLEENGITQVDVIKSDVEGFELPLLMGATSALDRCRPYLLLELNPSAFVDAGYRAEDLLQFLKERRYRTYEITDRRPGRHGVLVPLMDAKYCNVLSVPPGGGVP